MSDVRRLQLDEVDDAATMLARVFVGKPYPSLLSDDPGMRFAASRWLFAGVLRYGLLFGEVTVVGRNDGLAIWWAPEFVDATEERLSRVGLADAPGGVTPASWQRLLAYDETAEALHRQGVQGPHWYLCVIGVAPEAQGKGIATRLLDSTFARLDREQLPVYLDTNTPENVAFYQRRGFVVAAEATDPGSGIHIRGMRRDPRVPQNP